VYEGEIAESLSWALNLGHGNILIMFALTSSAGEGRPKPI
jgi:hypothetical protein